MKIVSNFELLISLTLNEIERENKSIGAKIAKKLA